jgi:hypothetical protein
MTTGVLEPGQAGSRRLVAVCGFGMIAAILINGPLSNLVGREPTYWNADAAAKFSGYLTRHSRVTEAIVFFALSNLIFIFGVGFFAGLRALARPGDATGMVSGVITFGTALFFAGGLLSETLSTGIALVVRTTPAYHLDVNNALLLHGLWAAALAQGQVGLALAVIAFCWHARRQQLFSEWLLWLGLVAGALTVLRLAVVTHIPLWIALLQPMFVWVLALSAVLVRGERPAIALTEVRAA